MAFLWRIGHANKIQGEQIYDITHLSFGVRDVDFLLDKVDKNERKQIFTDKKICRGYVRYLRRGKLRTLPSDWYEKAKKNMIISGYGRGYCTPAFIPGKEYINDSLSLNHDFYQYFLGGKRLFNLQSPPPDTTLAPDSTRTWGFETRLIFMYKRQKNDTVYFSSRYVYENPLAFPSKNTKRGEEIGVLAINGRLYQHFFINRDYMDYKNRYRSKLPIKYIKDLIQMPY